MLFSATAFAQQQGPAADATDNTVPQQAQLVTMASDLVRYGYAQKAALPLIQLPFHSSRPYRSTRASA